MSYCVIDGMNLSKQIYLKNTRFKINQRIDFERRGNRIPSTHQSSGTSKTKSSVIEKPTHRFLKQSVVIEHSESTNFKVLQRETSVYKYYIELKADALTEHGFFDLTKVPGLRLTGAGQFFKNLRLKNHLRQKDLAKFFNIDYQVVGAWENNRTSIPLHALLVLAEISGLSRFTFFSLMKQRNFNTKKELPVEFEKILDIVKYLIPHRKVNHTARITLLKCSEGTLSKVKTTLNVEPRSYSNKKVICSRELHNYLTTFFRYTKVPKICPPLTNEIRQWHDNSVDLKRAVIIPCLQSDGCIAKRYQGDKSYRIIFYGNNKVLHDYFVDAMYYEYNLLPSSYFVYNSRERFTAYEKRSTSEIMNEIVDEIMNLAGNTKTAPIREQTAEEYLNGPQPHLNYLKNAPKTERKLALRIWASTEGHISIYKRNSGCVSPVIGIGCAHPILVEQMQQIANGLDFPIFIKRDSSIWSGIQGLITQSLVSCINFIKLGGFIEGVKIGASSRYHEGINKDLLILGILEYIRKRKTTNKSLEKLPIDVHHKKVNKIIENREYKSMDYYIDYFS